MPVSHSHLPQLPNNISFASELIKARSELGLTQSQLATESGLSLSAVKAYESGRNMPGARELRNLCQAVQVSPNKLLFGKELPFESQSVMNALTDTESENDMVARMRATMLLYMLAADEREALLTLAKSLAIARHGEEAVRQQVLGADFFTGMMREMMEQTREAVVTGQPVDTAAFAPNLEKFLERQGHKPAPEKLLKK